MPGTCASFGRSDAMTSSTERLRWLARDELDEESAAVDATGGVVAYQPDVVRDARDVGSAMTISASCS
jgi:hypothetical protein